MLYRRYTPPPPLAAFVGCLWYSEGLQGTHHKERLLPNGESGIVFDLRDRPVRIYDALNPSQFQTYAPALFVGARTDSFVIDTSDQERVIGIQFRPGGAFPFLNLPAFEVANDTYALDDIWPTEASLIRERLLESPNIGTMFRILERALLSQLRDKTHPHPAIHYALRNLSRPTPGVQIRNIVEEVGLSSRHFTELFRIQSGLTPKAFHRVRRFQSILQALRTDSGARWTDLAADYGYFDQAHFIHDFKHYSGMTPGEYVTVATPHLNHLPLV